MAGMNFQTHLNMWYTRFGVFIREKLPKNYEGQKNKCAESVWNSTHLAVQPGYDNMIFWKKSRIYFKKNCISSILFILPINRQEVTSLAFPTLKRFLDKSLIDSEL